MRTICDIVRTDVKKIEVLYDKMMKYAKVFLLAKLGCKGGTEGSATGYVSKNMAYDHRLGTSSQKHQGKEERIIIE